MLFISASSDSRSALVPVSSAKDSASWSKLLVPSWNSIYGITNSVSGKPSEASGVTLALAGASPRDVTGRPVPTETATTSKCKRCKADWNLDHINRFGGLCHSCYSAGTHGICRTCNKAFTVATLKKKGGVCGHCARKNVSVIRVESGDVVPVQQPSKPEQSLPPQSPSTPIWARLTSLAGDTKTSIQGSRPESASGSSRALASDKKTGHNRSPSKLFDMLISAGQAVMAFTGSSNPSTVAKPMTIGIVGTAAALGSAQEAAINRVPASTSGLSAGSSDSVSLAVPTAKATVKSSTTLPCAKCGRMLKTKTLAKYGGTCGKCSRKIGFKPDREGQPGGPPIPKTRAILRQKVWRRQFDKAGVGMCPLCKLNEVDPFTFQLGHDIAKGKGGKLNVENLLPVCPTCNMDQGMMSFEEYVRTIGDTAVAAPGGSDLTSPSRTPSNGSVDLTSSSRADTPPNGSPALASVKWPANGSPPGGPDLGLVSSEVPVVTGPQDGLSLNLTPVHQPMTERKSRVDLPSSYYNSVHKPSDYARQVRADGKKLPSVGQLRSQVVDLDSLIDDINSFELDDD